MSTLVVFVGDEPSSLNKHPTIPFVGSACFNRLVRWIEILSPDYYVVLDSNTTSDRIKIASLEDAGFKVVALGSKASSRLEGISVKHFTMPHPSGLNRILNDDEGLKDKLGACWNYVRGINKRLFDPHEETVMDELLREV